MTTQGTSDLGQEELMTTLLEGAEPDAYVVISAAALSSQIKIALAETVGRGGEARPGHATARLLRNLQALGFTRNTRYPRTQP